VNLSQHPREDLNNKNATGQKSPKQLKKVPKGPFYGVNTTQHLTALYHYHINYIREWVATHPGHVLVDLDITNEAAGKILAETFGLHEDCWGHHNKREDNPRKKGNLFNLQREQEKTLKRGFNSRAREYEARLRDRSTNKWGKKRKE
jgi:hypothetical protein